LHDRRGPDRQETRLHRDLCARTAGGCPSERIGLDLREERFIAHTLQLAIQAALDVASHIVSERRLGEPVSNRQMFDLLARDGWLAPALASMLGNMAGFRNILVHGYQEVDNAILRDVVECRLEDLLTFVALIREKLAAQ
jgi:uncharacterized protein YutE (UPF0331/DUF86 family)